MFPGQRKREVQKQNLLPPDQFPVADHTPSHEPILAS